MKSDVEDSVGVRVLSVTPGETYNWNLYHRGRSGQEIMALIIGNKQENEPLKTNKTTESADTKKRPQNSQIIRKCKNGPSTLQRPKSR